VKKEPSEPPKTKKTTKKSESTSSKKPLVIADKKSSPTPKEILEKLDYQDLIQSFEGAIFANIITTPEGKLLYCNNAFVTMFGFKSKEEAIQYPIKKLYRTENDRLGFLDALKKNKKLENLEAFHVSVDGKTINTLENMVGIFDDAGNLVRIMGNLIDITQRKMTEQILRENEEKFRKSFYFNPDSINVNRLNDGVYVSINAGFTSIMGYTEEDVLGKSSLDLEIWVNHDDRKKLVEGLQKNGFVTNQESLFRKKNGDLVNGLMSASIIELSGVPHIISITRDITEWKKAEELSRKSELKLHAIFAAMSDVIMELNSEGRYIEIGPSNPSLLYKPPVEILGKTMHEIFPKEQADFFLSKVQETLATKKIIPLSYELTIDDKKFWFSAHLSPLTADTVLLVARDFTEQKLIEERLRLSDNTYQGIINSIAEAIYIQDSSGTFLDVNEGAVRMYGYTREELIGKNPLFVSADGLNDMHAVLQCVNNAFKGIPQQFDFWGKRKNGEIFPKFVRLYKGTYFEKEVLIAVATDMSQQKKAEIALKESESRYHQLVENSPLGIYRTTPDGKILACNAVLLRMLGYASFDEFAAFNLEENAQTYNRQYFKERIEKDDYIRGYEVKWQKKDGTDVWVRENARVVRDSSGNTLFYDGTVEDITEWKLTEQKLNESEELFRNLVDNITDVFYTTDTSGKMLFCNSNFYLFSGFSPEEIIGHSYIRVVHPEDRERVIEHYAKATASGDQDTNMELRVQRKDGSIFWTAQNTRILRDAKGKVVEYRTIARDVTKNKEAEESLRRNEERFRLISNLTSDYIFSTILNKDGTTDIEWVMGAFERITGYTQEEFKTIGGWRAVIHPDDIKNDASAFAQLKKNQTVISEVRTYHKNGTLTWMRTYASPVWDENENRVTRIYGAVQDITEQKLLQQLRIESEKKFRNIVEGTKAILFNTDTAGRITYANQAACDVLGYPLKTLLGRFYLSFVHKDDKRRIFDHFAEQANSKNLARSIDFRIVNAEGEIRWLSFLVNILFQEEAQIGFTGVAQNITERKHAEEALSRSESHFRSVWESSIDGMRLTDETGTIVSVNDAFAKLFEKKKEEIIGKSFTVVYGKDSGFNDVQSFIRHFKERSIQPFMQRDITLWYGKPMSVELANSFVEIEGQPPLLLSIFNDVTERVKNERLLKESNEFNASLISSLPFGMDIIDETGTILFQNENLEKITGKNLRGQKCWDMYNGKQEQCHKCPLFMGIEIGRTSSIQKDNIIAGKVFEVFTTGIIFQGKKALLETFVDISERKEAERQITQAKEKAEEANKVKTNFLKNMSHELRTPMIPILGFTEFISDMQLPEEVRSMAQMMHKSAQRLMETLNIILDLAQVERDRIVIQPKQFDMLTVLDDLCSLFQPMAKEKNLYLQKDFSIDKLLVTTDQRMITHAVNNLLNNGIKFTHLGGITLKASRIKENGKVFALIQVIDSGIGIPKGFMEIIWEEFRQASEGMGRSFEGNGLGLTITKSFVEKLGGTVWCESELGKGSVFTIKLPADDEYSSVIRIVEKDEKIAEAFTQVPQTPVVTPPAPEISLPKILYVEDEETSYSVVKYFLKNMVTLDWAKSGQEGVVMARSDRYHAILMDINLARGIDGMQTTKLIRELPNYKTTPIIAITAYAMRGDKEEFLNAGCSHYLSKPFTKAALLTLMEEIIANKENK